MRSELTHFSEVGQVEMVRGTDKQGSKRRVNRQCRAEERIVISRSHLSVHRVFIYLCFSA